MARMTAHSLGLSITLPTLHKAPNNSLAVPAIPTARLINVPPSMSSSSLMPLTLALGLRRGGDLSVPSGLCRERMFSVGVFDGVGLVETV